MSLSERLKNKKKRLEDRLQKARVLSEQMKAEKRRKKIIKAKGFEPGTFRYGLFHHQGIGDFYRDVKKRRMGDKK